MSVCVMPEEIEEEELWYDYFGQPAKDVDEILPLPPEPTGFLPGTKEKTDLVAWRILNGFQANHPLDALGREITSKTDHPCITICANGFKVETTRLVDGVRKRFKRLFEYMDDALDWLEGINAKYPSQRKRG